MIRAENIGFKYKCGRVVLSEINFSLNDGEIAAILGNNGAGKSTLLKCLLGRRLKYHVVRLSFPKRKTHPE